VLGTPSLGQERERRLVEGSQYRKWFGLTPRHDKRAIFTAATLLHGLPPKAETAAELGADDYRAAA
jgi:hypothetical protein